MRDSYKVYGFAYAFDGRRYTFTVLSHSADDAKRQAAAMADHMFVGELMPVDPSCALPQTDDSAVAPIAAQ
jgi:hypothetical protein